MQASRGSCAHRMDESANGSPATKIGSRAYSRFWMRHFTYWALAHGPPHRIRACSFAAEPLSRHWSVFCVASQCSKTIVFDLTKRPRPLVAHCSGIRRTYMNHVNRIYSLPGIWVGVSCERYTVVARPLGVLWDLCVEFLLRRDAIAPSQLLARRLRHVFARADAAPNGNAVGVWTLCAALRATTPGVRLRRPASKGGSHWRENAARARRRALQAGRCSALANALT